MYFLSLLFPLLFVHVSGSMVGFHSSPGQPRQQSRPQIVAQASPVHSQIRPIQAQQFQPQPQPQPQTQPQPQPQPQPQVQPHLKSIQPPQAQPQQSNYYSRGYHKITTYPDRTTRYLHSYNTDDNSHYDYRSWMVPERASAVRSAYQYQNPRPVSGSYVDQRSIVPQNNVFLVPAHAPSPPEYPAPVASQYVPGLSYAANQYNSRQVQYQRADPREISARRVNNGSELTSPAVTRQPSTYQPRFDSMETLIYYIKSPSFLKQIKSLGSQDLFRSNTVGSYVAEDEALIEANSAKNESNLTFEQDDCRPKMTTIKFGFVDQPHILFNPPSVEVPRCSQGCFSWQFDCIPTEKATHNVTVAVYTIDGDKISREVNDFSIVSHKSCACSCQSLAGCFGSTKFSAQRLPAN